MSLEKISKLSEIYNASDDRSTTINTVRQKFQNINIRYVEFGEGKITYLTSSTKASLKKQDDTA